MADRCGRVINRALHTIFETDPGAYLLGEDVLDPYGGAFRITAGLSTRWPERVLTTPISEAAITGIAAGMALRGLHPIVEIMFGDFITLAFDQIVNYIAKFSAMYNRQTGCPVVVRTPMGGRRGYGPTHSQSLEKLALGIPGLVVVAPSRYHALDQLLIHAVTRDPNPVVYIENKLMYGMDNTVPLDGRLELFKVQTSAGAYPTLRLSLNEFAAPDAVLITYGGSAPLALEAAWRLADEDELFVEVVIVSQFSPLPLADLQPALRNCQAVMTLEEGTLRGGWGAEVIAALSEAAASPLRVRRVAARDAIIPAARPLEDLTLPQVAQITDGLRQLTKGRR